MFERLTNAGGWKRSNICRKWVWPGAPHQKTETEKPEDPERDDGGDDDGGGEVDGGLRPVHREAGERVRVERLVVLLVHPVFKNKNV